jgi:hypothetical protein
MNAAGRSFLWATHYCEAQATYPEVMARRAGTLSAEAEIPPYLVLLRVGFALPGALLLQRCALTAPFHPYLSLAARAVYFLWHFPSNRLKPAVPDVIRHTALRSSDFPPVLRRATVRSGCQLIHYSAGRFAGHEFRRQCAYFAVLIPALWARAGMDTPAGPHQSKVGSVRRDKPGRRAQVHAEVP